MSLSLLDVNVLIAVAWPNHVFHRRAAAFMDECGVWATCAVTQLGFLRLSMNPRAVNTPLRCRDAVLLLEQMIEDERHRYLASAPVPAEIPNAFHFVMGYGQITDAYLLGMAAQHNARFVTLDAKLRSLPGVAVLS